MPKKKRKSIILTEEHKANISKATKGKPKSLEHSINIRNGLMRELPKNAPFMGKKFGSVTIINKVDHYTEPSGKRFIRVGVRCDCGNEFMAYLVKVKGNQYKSCVKCWKGKIKRSVNIGDKYDKLTVISYASEIGKDMIKCVCDCGNEVIKRIFCLKDNYKNSCGCEHTYSWKGYGEISGTFFKRIKRNASARKIKFKLTLKQLWELYLSQNGKCNLTGISIDFGWLDQDETTASLDRIDSSLDYNIKNVQWVHKDINLMKFDLTMDRFKELCKLVDEYN